MRKVIAVFLCAGFLIMGSACEKTPNGKSTPSIEINYDGNHITAQLDEHLLVDADINTAGEFEQADTFKAKPMNFKTAENRELLLDGSDIKEETEEYIATTDQKSIYIYNQDCFFETENFEYVSNIALLDPIYVSYNADKFSQTLDFDFMTREQAIAEGQKLLKTLGFKEELIARQIYTLDYETLQAQENYFKTDPEFLTQLKPEETPEWKNAWTSDDNYYYIFFTPVYNGIPITETEHGNDNIGTEVSGSHIEICYSKMGLEYLSAQFLYSTTETEEESSPLIGIDTMLKAIKNKYSDVILTDDVVFRSVSSCYVPIVANDNENPYRLVPAWCLTGAQIFEDSKDLEGNPVEIPLTVFINAVTGEEII